MAKSRFDFEQELLNCWRVTDDLEDLLSILDQSQDVTINLVIGLQTLYEIKFNKLWATFEELVSNEVM